MATQLPITNGPNAFDMAVNLFYTKREPLVFTLEDGSSIAVLIDSALRLNASGHDYELDLFVPYPQLAVVKVRYDCHTRKGVILEWTDQHLGQADDELGRIEHAMAHGVHRQT